MAINQNGKWSIGKKFKVLKPSVKTHRTEFSALAGILACFSQKITQQNSFDRGFYNLKFFTYGPLTNLIYHPLARIKI
jgi:hypothetical protein